MRVQVQVYDTSKEVDDDSDDDNGGGGISCFSSTSVVDVWNVDGGVPMKDLKVHDRVRTGKNRYQPVYAFGHYNEDTPTEFVKLSYQTSAGKTKSIELSGEHLLYIQDQARPVRADSVAHGDMLLHADARDVRVTRVTNVTREGYYAPLTADGTIVVDGLVASVYATLLTKSQSEKIELNGWTVPGVVDQETFLHLAVAPLRMLCQMNLNLYDGCQITGNQADAEGFNVYVSWGVAMIRWGENQHPVVQAVVFILALIGFGALNILEGFLCGEAGPFWKEIMALITVAFFLATFGSEKKGSKAWKTTA